MTTPALAAWGAYNQDDPFPVFAEVRELGAVHEVTLADGHRAWLVVRSDEARGARDAPRRSPRAPILWQRGFPDQRSRDICSALTRPITLGCVGLCRRPFLPAASKGCGRGGKPSGTTSSVRPPCTAGAGG